MLTEWTEAEELCAGKEGGVPREDYRPRRDKPTNRTTWGVWRVSPPRSTSFFFLTSAASVCKYRRQRP